MAKDEKKPLIPWWGWLLIVLAVGVVGGTGYYFWNKSKQSDSEKEKEKPNLDPLLVKPDEKAITPPQQPVTVVDTNGNQSVVKTATPVSVNSREAQKAIEETEIYISGDQLWLDGIYERSGIKKLINSLSYFPNFNVSNPTFAGAVFKSAFLDGKSISELAKNHFTKRIFLKGGFYPTKAKIPSDYTADSVDFMLRNVPESKSLTQPELKIGLDAAISELAVLRSMADSAVRQDAIASLKNNGWVFTDA